MTVLKFDLDIDAEIQKLGLPIANPANRLGSQIKISNPTMSFHWTLGS